MKLFNFRHSARIAYKSISYVLVHVSKKSAQLRKLARRNCFRLLNRKTMSEFISKCIPPVVLLCTRVCLKDN